MQEASVSRPDVVVTDFSMPGMNGLEFTAWLHKNCPDCEVVILTAEAAAVTHRAIAGIEFTLLQKPVESQILVSAVQALSQKQGQLTSV